MQGGTRYYSINEYLRMQFGAKTVKLSVDAGFTCPNRDGSLGYGGCAFCSPEGSGELASSIEDQIELLSVKWPDAKYLAYFQSHTNTYAPVEKLREIYYKALDHPMIEGLAISTRPDCLGDDVLDLLQEINEIHFLWVELGLQTTNPETQKQMNLCYSTDQFDRAVEELSRRNIKTVVHLMLGLPGDSEEDMLESLKHAVSQDIFGLKLHLFNLVKGSRLAQIYPDYVSFDSIEEYVDLVVRMLELIPPHITIHRLTGDVPRKLLISPDWSWRKRTILNSINKELETRNTKQGASIDTSEIQNKYQV